MVAAWIGAFRETTRYWPPEAMSSDDHLEKLAERTLEAALASTRPTGE